MVYPKSQRYLCSKDENGEWFDKTNTQALIAFSHSPYSTRIFGMPSFIYEFAQYMHSKGVKLALPPDSLLLTGGGWKASEDKKVTKEDFRALCSETLGLSETRMRDGYGMAEHCAPYNECRNHRFHIPVYTRVLVRDPLTLNALPPGQTGILELITPFNARPNLALLTTDLGVVDANPVLVGSINVYNCRKTGLSKHKGCALHADEIVKRSRNATSLSLHAKCKVILMQLLCLKKLPFDLGLGLPSLVLKIGAQLVLSSALIRPKSTAFKWEVIFRGH